MDVRRPDGDEDDFEDVEGVEGVDDDDNIDNMMMVLIFANRSLEPLVGCSEAARRRGVALWSRWGGSSLQLQTHPPVTRPPSKVMESCQDANVYPCICMHLHVFACTSRCI